MNFLVKLGQIALRIATLETGLMPLVRATVPQSAMTMTAEDKLDQAVHAVITVQQIATAAGGQLTGADKLKAATPFVAQIVQRVEAISGKHPKDPAKFETAVTQMTSALADILASFE